MIEPTKKLIDTMRRLYVAQVAIEAVGSGPTPANKAVVVNVLFTPPTHFRLRANGDSYGRVWERERMQPDEFDAKTLEHHVERLVRTALTRETDEDRKASSSKSEQIAKLFEGEVP